MGCKGNSRLWYLLSKLDLEISTQGLVLKPQLIPVPGH